jgi:hypothetical protein
MEKLGSHMIREHKCTKKPRQPPHPHQLEAYVVSAAVAHVIIHLLDLYLPPPFHRVEEFLFYEDFFWVGKQLTEIAEVGTISIVVL